MSELLREASRSRAGLRTPELQTREELAQTTEATVSRGRFGYGATIVEQIESLVKIGLESSLKFRAQGD